MLRNFGISLLFLGLLASGIDGFRTRDRVRSAVPSATEQGDLHTAEAGGACGLCIPR
jgi:hypothetical protein